MGEIKRRANKNRIEQETCSQQDYVAPCQAMRAWIPSMRKVDVLQAPVIGLRDTHGDLVSCAPPNLTTAFNYTGGSEYEPNGATMFQATGITCYLVLIKRSLYLPCGSGIDATAMGKLYLNAASASFSRLATLFSCLGIKLARLRWQYERW